MQREKKSQPAAAAQQPEKHALLITFCARLYSRVTSTVQSVHTVHIKATSLLATISKLGIREFFLKMGDIIKEVADTF
jgi:hypothetical protein